MYSRILISCIQELAERKNYQQVLNIFIGLTFDDYVNIDNHVSTTESFEAILAREEG